MEVERSEKKKKKKKKKKKERERKKSTFELAALREESFVHDIQGILQRQNFIKSL